MKYLLMLLLILPFSTFASEPKFDEGDCIEFVVTYGTRSGQVLRVDYEVRDQEIRYQYKVRYNSADGFLLIDFFDEFELQACK